MKKSPPTTPTISDLEEDMASTTIMNSGSAAAGTAADSSSKDNNSNAAAASSATATSRKTTILDIPFEVQLNILTFLRAYELSNVQITCKLYRDPKLIHNIVSHTAEYVYPNDLTKGFEQEPTLHSPNISSATGTNITTAKHPKKHNHPKLQQNKQQQEPHQHQHQQQPYFYTLEHLRNMELLVVARALSRPEPKSTNIGNNFYVSKGWCRTALRWLEVQQEQREERQRLHQLQQQQQQQQHGKKGGNKFNKEKKLTKKQQRLRQRKLSDASPPWSNVNIDLLCPHDKLQHCNNKSARARRRLMDKQAWKCLKKLYPDSTQLNSVEGECVQCRLEMETVKKNQLDILNEQKIERKKPLSNPIIRRFYTRTRGVPTHCLKQQQQQQQQTTDTTEISHDFCDNDNDNDVSLSTFDNSCHYLDDDKNDDEEDVKVFASSDDSFRKDCDDCNYIRGGTNSNSSTCCPLQPGIYYVIPRAWCHVWRKYIKTGEGGPISAPDASGLLCNAHRLSLLPPHLEAYLYGDSPQLFLASSINSNDTMAIATAPTPMSSTLAAATPPTAAAAPARTMTPPPPAAARTTTSSVASVASSQQQQQYQAPVVGQHIDLDDNTVQELLASGISLNEIASQQLAMYRHHHSRKHQNCIKLPKNKTCVSPPVPSSPVLARPKINNGSNTSNTTPTTPATLSTLAAASGAALAVTESNNDRLDRENYICVEILTQEEWNELDKLFPRQSFGLSFAITHSSLPSSLSSSFKDSSDFSLNNINTDQDEEAETEITFSTLPCRDCDPTGLASNSSLTIRSRRKRWLKNVSSDKRIARSPITKLEY